MAPYVQTSESQLVALCQLPLPFVCKSQHLEVHGRLVNKLSRTHSGRPTSGKTLRLKYCLSSSSMSAQGLQDSICSLHVPKTWKPACTSFTPNQSHKRVIPQLPSSSQHLFSFPSSMKQMAMDHKSICAFKSAATRPHLPPHLRHRNDKIINWHCVRAVCFSAVSHSMSVCLKLTDVKD